MAQRKPYNMNTAYGRRKAREQARETYDNLPPDKKNDWDAAAIVIIVIVIILAIILLGPKDAAKWLSR